jgi:hypothetical protein
LDFDDPCCGEHAIVAAQRPVALIQQHAMAAAGNVGELAAPVCGSGGSDGNQEPQGVDMKACRSHQARDAREMFRLPAIHPFVNGGHVKHPQVAFAKPVACIGDHGTRVKALRHLINASGDQDVHVIASVRVGLT